MLNVGDEFGQHWPETSGVKLLIAVWGAGDSGWLADRALHATQVRLTARHFLIEVDGSFGKLTVKRSCWVA